MAIHKGGVSDPNSIDARCCQAVVLAAQRQVPAKVDVGSAIDVNTPRRDCGNNTGRASLTCFDSESGRISRVVHSSATAQACAVGDEWTTPGSSDGYGAHTPDAEFDGTHVDGESVFAQFFSIRSGGSLRHC